MWAREQPSYAKAWTSCKRADWLLWLAGVLCRDEATRKTIAMSACACAREALRHTRDPRVLACIETVEAWCRGAATIEAVRAARRTADDAYAAAAAANAAAAYAAANAAYAAAAAAAAAADAAAAAAAAANAADAYAYAAYAETPTPTPPPGRKLTRKWRRSFASMSSAPYWRPPTDDPSARPQAASGKVVR